MSLDDEENRDMRFANLQDTPRPKTPSRYVQKENPQIHILGDHIHGVQTKRKLVGSSSCVNIALLSQIEPKNLIQESEDKFWVRAMNEELDQV